MRNIAESIWNLFTNKYLLIASWSITPFTKFFGDFVFQDWHFFMNLMVLVFVDTILGLFAAYKTKQVSSEGFSKVLAKLFTYFMLLVATHTAVNIKVNQETLTLLTWVDSMVYTLIVVRELISIFEKTAMIGYFKIPTWILEKLKYFDETGNLKDTDKK